MNKSFLALAGVSAVTMMACGGGGGSSRASGPEISASDVSVAEGASGKTTDMSFTIKLNKAHDGALTVKYKTADDTAKAGSDYTAADGTARIAKGETSTTVVVKVTGDSRLEEDEKLKLSLSEASAGTIKTASVVGTIRDDETGASEPLYKYQWGLNLKDSFFKDFSEVADLTDGKDLNVEPVHEQGYKGQGVKVLVLDTGVEIAHEDLTSNVDNNRTHNFEDGNKDPTPAKDQEHGTNVAGIIAAAQNGKGVMGIAPRASLGGANYQIEDDEKVDDTAAYGGADWSKTADIINLSLGVNPTTPLSWNHKELTEELTAIRAFPKLRDGKGLVFIKAGGNEYGRLLDDNNDGSSDRECPEFLNGLLGCENAANDPERLEPNVIVVAAANAKGVRASYSNVGSVNFITGVAGEDPSGGSHGQRSSSDGTSGPAMYTTDLSGCVRGSAYTDASDVAEFDKCMQENTKGDYTGDFYGTSAAAPTVSGVVALMLSANPNLTWRDVKDILRKTARKLDASYGTRDKRNMLVDLSKGEITTTAANSSNQLQHDSTMARLDYGWQENGANINYSNWYGFGLVDAAAAVNMSKSYTSASATLTQPDFKAAFSDQSSFTYGKVQKLGEFTVADSGTPKVDMLQLRVTGSICIGSVGFFVKSPAGTVSPLAVPYNSWYSTDVKEADKYGLGSYAFYGENANGKWEVYSVSGVPVRTSFSIIKACSNYSGGAEGGQVTLSKPLKVEYRYFAIP